MDPLIKRPSISRGTSKTRIREESRRLRGSTVRRDRITGAGRFYEIMNRRAFLVGSAAATAAFAQSEQKSVRTGMIGVGNRGSYLLEAVTAQSVAKVVAVCDN